jgi:bifunctional UDP-N-acetylglucosamine pyrophosphorylase/glucosamine-1-phosphate N-acetyltransferase
MNFKIIILCAGKGSRMKDFTTPKVCKKVHGIPMILYIFETAKKLCPKEIIIVVSEENKEIISKTINSKEVRYVVQGEKSGTAGAVLSAEEFYKGYNILVLLGDVPFLKHETLHKIVSSQCDGAILGFLETESNRFGRIILKDNKVEKIVEYSEASEEEKKIMNVNSGILYLDNKYTYLLNEITNNNSKKEYYLTDIVKLLKCDYFRASKEECMGANTPEDLVVLEKLNNRNNFS